MKFFRTNFSRRTWFRMPVLSPAPDCSAWAPAQPCSLNRLRRLAATVSLAPSRSSAIAITTLITFE